MTEKSSKPTTMADLDVLLKEVYLDKLNDQLNHSTLVFGGRTFAPYKPSRREKWNKFWEHIPDFLNYIKAYEFHDWQYKE